VLKNYHMVANVKFTSYTLRNYIKHLILTHSLTHSLTHYYTLFLAYISYTIYAHTISHFQKSKTIPFFPTLSFISIIIYAFNLLTLLALSILSLCPCLSLTLVDDERGDHTIIERKREEKYNI
jgi:hypothetical protein